MREWNIHAFRGLEIVEIMFLRFLGNKNREIRPDIYLFDERYFLHIASAEARHHEFSLASLS